MKFAYLIAFALLALVLAVPAYQSDSPEEPSSQPPQESVGAPTSSLKARISYYRETRIFEEREQGNGIISFSARVPTATATISGKVKTGWGLPVRYAISPDMTIKDDASKDNIIIFGDDYSLDEKEAEAERKRNNTKRKKNDPPPELRWTRISHYRIPKLFGGTDDFEFDGKVDFETTIFSPPRKAKNLDFRGNIHVIFAKDFEEVTAEGVNGRLMGDVLLNHKKSGIEVVVSRADTESLTFEIKGEAAKVVEFTVVDEKGEEIDDASTRLGGYGEESTNEGRVSFYGEKPNQFGLKFRIAKTIQERELKISIQNFDLP